VAELKKHGFAVLVVVGQEATLEKLKSEPSRFFLETKKLCKENVVLLALSGHGRQALKGVSLTDGSGMGARLPGRQQRADEVSL
jgi:hypothetical protein